MLFTLFGLFADPVREVLLGVFGNPGNGSVSGNRVAKLITVE